MFNYWIIPSSLVNSFLSVKVLNSHTKFKKSITSLWIFKIIPTCVQPSSKWLLDSSLSSYYYCCYGLVLLLMCWCVTVMVIVIDVLLYLKLMRWSGSRVWETWNLSFCSLLEFSSKNTILGGKWFVSEIFPMVLFHKH